MPRFKTGQTLTTRFITNNDLVLTARVVKRTEKTVTIAMEGEADKRCKVFTDAETGEFIYPLGKYSMCPIFRAHRATWGKK